MAWSASERETFPFDVGVATNPSPHFPD
jgi:hypothetical protein